MGVGLKTSTTAGMAATVSSDATPIAPHRLSTMTTVSVVIVSYNTRELTLKCLTVLYADLGNMDAEVFVVDNGSVDGSAEAVRVSFPKVRVIALDRNVGFGAANNVAMEQAKSEFLLLLNSDAFVRDRAIAKLIDCMKSHATAAIVGPRLRNLDDSLQRSCFRFPSPTRAWLENLWISRLAGPTCRAGDYSRWPHDVDAEVDWVSGACMLVRRSAYAEVGGFDERFFMYAEETDWQRRMRDCGWSIEFTPSAEVVHFGGSSSTAREMNNSFFDSLDNYVKTHHGTTGLFSLRAAMIVGCGIRAIGWGMTWAIFSRKRTVAAAKLKLHSFLMKRQVFDWALLKRKKTLA